MSEVTAIEASFQTGGQVQVKKFDEQQRYEYQAKMYVTVAPDEDPTQVILERTAELQELLEPLAQSERDALIEVRNQNDEREADARRS